MPGFEGSFEKGGQASRVARGPGHAYVTQEQNTMDRVRVLIADEQPLFRQGVRYTLEQTDDIEVVAEAADGQATVQGAESFTPDVVLVDANIPLSVRSHMDSQGFASSGLEVVRMVKHRVPGTACVLLTAYEDEEQLFQSIKVGAAAYCLKDISPEELIDVVRRVSKGEYLINDSVLSRPMVASRVLKQFRELTAAADEEVEQLFVPLSQREIEILDYIAHGNSNKEIARALKISDQTVKNHITSILRKLAVNDRTQAVVYALRHGWIKMQGL